MARDAGSKSKDENRPRAEAHAAAGIDAAGTPGLAAHPLLATPSGRQALRRRVKARKQKAAAVPAQSHEPAAVEVPAVDAPAVDEAPIGPDVPGVEWVEPEIEQVSATDAELANEAAAMLGQQQDMQRAEELHRRVLNIQRGNLLKLYADARLATDAGINAFREQAIANPVSARADQDTGVLGGFAAGAVGVLKDLVPKWLDKIAGTGASADLYSPSGAPIDQPVTSSPGPLETRPRLVNERPMSDTRRMAATAGETVLGHATGGAVKIADGAMDTGVGAGIGVAMKVGAYLEGVHSEWVQAAMKSKLDGMTRRMSRDAQQVFNEIVAAINLMTDAEIERALRLVDLTRAVVTAPEISLRLELLWLDAIRSLLTANEYLDAARGVGARVREDAQHAFDQHGGQVTDERR